MGYSSTDSASISSGVVSGVAVWITGLVVTFVVAITQLNIGLYFLVRIAIVEGTLVGYIGLHTWFLSEFVDIVWLTIIPIGLLVISGFSLAPGSNGDPAAGFTDGAKITVGYLAMTLVAMGYLVTAAGGTVQIDGDFLLTVLTTGVVFPIVFGGLGGVLAESI